MTSEVDVKDSMRNGGGGAVESEEMDTFSSPKLNKLTYRQYLALALIVTKLEKNSTYPSKMELKEVIGFKTDRMLDITLDALEKKGFLSFNGLEQERFVTITEETKKLFPRLVDTLLLIDEYSPYSRIRDRISHKLTQDYLDIRTEHPLYVDKNYIEFLNNRKEIVNRWYTLLEDFSPSLVWERLRKHDISSDGTILDPFCGSGTTVVSAKLYGAKSIGIDVNPVATFVTKVKTTWEINAREFRKQANSLLNDLHEASSLLGEIRITTPALMNIPKMERNQWLKPYDQNLVAFVKERTKEVENKDIQDIFLLALVEAAQESSNAFFCPGTSFYPFKKRPTFFDAFMQKLRMIYEDLQVVKSYAGFSRGSVDIYTDDMRHMSEFIEPDSIDFIFTSPPYPNDLEYTRQTRLDLYLSDFVQNMDDIVEIKKKMVKGSTKLIYSESDSSRFVKDYPFVQNIVYKLKEAFGEKKWGWDYPRMIQEYFGDIFLAMDQARKVMKKSHYAEFVVGDQTFKKILIPVGMIMKKLALELDFKSCALEKYRLRRSTLHEIPLKEEIVILKK